MGSTQPTDHVLAGREVAALRWSITSRMVFLCVAPVLIMFLRHARPELLIVIPLMSLGIAASVVSLRRLKKPDANLPRLAAKMLIFDLTALIAMPLVWYFSIGEGNYSASFLMKGEITALAFVLLIVNTMTLRPLFPALITFKVVMLHLVILAAALIDDRTVFTDHPMDTLNGPQVNLVLFANRVLILLFTGVSLTLLARGARRTLGDIVALERENYRIQDQQARNIMEAKMDSLGNLVAGIAHEMNSPLGVLNSSASTLASCATKLRDENMEKREKAAALIEPSVGAVKDAASRLNSLVTSLRNFAHLDEAAVQKISIQSSIEEAIAMVPERLKGTTTVETKFENTSDIHARPSELNQVFLTLLRNAFEAMNGQGQLALRTREEEGKVVAEIADSGPGMDEERVEQLFDVNIKKKKSGRMGVGWGLPAARRIIERHGGTIEVESRPGSGTRFFIRIPIQRGEVTGSSPLNT